MKVVDVLLVCIFSSVRAIDFDPLGYILYCPCMGRFGNQADHFLGALAFAKGLNRTLVLPAWIEYRFGERRSTQVPFDIYFKVKPLEKYHKVISMEKFIKEIAPYEWPPDQRISFCYMARGDSDSCNAKDGNPFGPFWDTYGVDFVGSEFYGPLNYDVSNNKAVAEQWKDRYPSTEWPVMAFTDILQQKYASFREGYNEEGTMNRQHNVEEWLSKIDIPYLRPKDENLNNENQRINVLSNVLLSEGTKANEKIFDPYEFSAEAELPKVLHSTKINKSLEIQNLSNETYESISVQPNKTVPNEYYNNQQHYIEMANKYESQSKEEEMEPPCYEDDSIVDPTYEPSEISEVDYMEESPDLSYIKSKLNPNPLPNELSIIEENSDAVVNVENKSTKDFCPICYEEVGHFSRHLLRSHKDEELVKKILEMPIKSNDRRTAIMTLRKRGNFILNEQKNRLKVVRAPNKPNNITTQDNYYVCVNCLGYYKKSYLWRHRKICKSNPEVKSSSSNNHLSESQTFLATSGLLGNFLNKSRIKKEVFNIMRPDNISYAAKTDPLICLFGESYISKHKRRQMNTVVSNKMRELARLKLVLVQSTSIKNLMEVLQPELYEHIVAAAKIVSGYDVEKKTYKASSLALHYGTNLKFLCDVAKKAIITKNPLFILPNQEEKIKQIKQIRDMINMHWCNDVSSLANKVLNEQKHDKPKLLPLTEDVQKLNSYIKLLSENAFENLKNNIDAATNYKILAECTMVLVLVFNRKRIGEVQFLDIASYENRYVSTNQEECLSSLTDLEKCMSATFKRVVVFGKGSKPVPILFTKLMQKYIDLLLTIRKTTSIVPKSNIYVFANPGSIDRWMSGPSVLRKLAQKCGAKSPELLTSTRFRKQVATILQLMNFENNEMEQIARFMGHTEKTHKEFYRLTEDVYQTAKVAKVLLLLNNGKGLEFKGKNLNQIEVDDDIIDEESDDKDENNQVEEISNLKILSENKYVNDKVIKPIPCYSKTSTRIRWKKTDKTMVLKYFKNHLTTKTAPKKEECLKFININSEIFTPTDWVRIKALVSNTYRDKK